MKVLFLLAVAAFIFGRGKKESTVQAAVSKAPDCDKPEQFLWSIMFGGDQNHSVLVKLIAAITFIGGQVAVELIKSWR
jgi:hypothetical protein